VWLRAGKVRDGLAEQLAQTRMQLKAALVEAKRRDSDLARMEEEKMALDAEHKSFCAGVQVLNVETGLAFGIGHHCEWRSPMSVKEGGLVCIIVSAQPVSTMLINVCEVVVGVWVSPMFHHSMYLSGISLSLFSRQDKAEQQQQPVQSPAVSSLPTLASLDG
jgi:hypothetical protein